MIIYFEKKYTETLSVMLDRFRAEYPEYQNSKVTYAGRLDPMASGTMILLTDEDVHQKDQYIQKNKMYTVSFLLGYSTDTYDVLGIPTQNNPHKVISKKDIENAIRDTQNIRTMDYPAYSSKTINGVPLWKQAREGNPLVSQSRDVHIYSSILNNIEQTPATEILKDITDALQKVEGDFRQQEIMDAWSDLLQNSPDIITIVNAQFTVSSGTYIRSLVDYIGKKLAVGATSIHIHRKAIGIDK